MPLQTSEATDQALKTGSHCYALEDLAWARSGDKGDSCNIGVIARHPAYLPYIKHHLTEESVAEFFSHYVKGKTTRYDVPGIGAFIQSRMSPTRGYSSKREHPRVGDILCL